MNTRDVFAGRALIIPVVMAMRRFRDTPDHRGYIGLHMNFGLAQYLLVLGQSKVHMQPDVPSVVRSVPKPSHSHNHGNYERPSSEDIPCIHHALTAKATYPQSSSSSSLSYSVLSSPGTQLLPDAMPMHTVAGHRSLGRQRGSQDALSICPHVTRVIVCHGDTLFPVLILSLVNLH